MDGSGRGRRAARLGGLVAALALLAAGTGHAAPAELHRFEVPVGTVYFDFAAGLLALVGSEPERGCVGVADPQHLLSIQAIDLPTGNRVATVWARDVPVYVYAATDVGEVCGPVHQGIAPPTPIAVGTVSARGTDNDVGIDGPRTNTWGSVAHGTVVRTDGARCQLRMTFRELGTAEDGFRVLHETIHLACGGR